VSAFRPSSPGESSNRFRVMPAAVLYEPKKIGDRVVVKSGPSAGRHGEVSAKRGCNLKVRLDGDGRVVSMYQGEVQLERERPA